MSEVKILGASVPNVPWQEGPEEFHGAPIWRYSENPVIGRNPIREVARIFNSAVMPYEGAFIGVFRGEQTSRHSLHLSWKEPGWHSLGF